MFQTGRGKSLCFGTKPRENDYFWCIYHAVSPVFCLSVIKQLPRASILYLISDQTTLPLKRSLITTFIVMYSALILTAFAAIAAASPAPQNINFAAVTATTVLATGPAVGVASQVGVYNTASAVAAASAQVSVIASASATGGNAAPSGVKKKRQDATSCSTSSSMGAVASVTSSVVASSTNATTTTLPIVVPNDGATLSACSTQPGGYGPQVTPDTVAAFEAYTPFHSEAQAAVAPKGYVQTFANLNASVSGSSYLGYYLLTSYDTVGCSQYCDNTTLCTGFNLYIERDPSVNPAANCSNPPSITNYGCSLWGSGVSASAATNSGQYRNDFQVVIVASDGYEKTNTTTPVTPPGWTNPQNCSSHAHNHPSTCIGTTFFPGPFNPSVCAAYASAQNAKNSQTSNFYTWLTFFYNPLKCNFFNAYMLKQDGAALGTYCSLYAWQYQPSAATYRPGWNAGRYYEVESSWTFCSK